MREERRNNAQTNCHRIAWNYNLHNNFSKEISAEKERSFTKYYDNASK
jgi:hypothetical protein